MPTVSIIIRLRVDRTQWPNNPPQRATSVSDKFFLGLLKSFTPGCVIKPDLIMIRDHQISTLHQALVTCSATAMRQNILQTCNSMSASSAKLTSMNKTGPTPTLNHIKTQSTTVTTMTIIQHKKILDPKITIRTEKIMKPANLLSSSLISMCRCQ